MTVVVDSSALLAIRRGEPERIAFHRLLLRTGGHISVATLAELGIIWQARFGAAQLHTLDRLVELYRLTVEPVTVEDWAIFRKAILDYAKGRAAPPAILNYGDLFGYALAKRLGLPLLFKGEDFIHTDVTQAFSV